MSSTDLQRRAGIQQSCQDLMQWHNFLQGSSGKLQLASRMGKPRE
jgi:hypothetical protein